MLTQLVRNGTRIIKFPMTLLQITIVITSITAVVSWYPHWVPGEQSYHGVHNGAEHAKSFADEWTVQVDGGEEVAQLVALEFGFVYGGPVSSCVSVLLYSIVMAT